MARKAFLLFYGLFSIAVCVGGWVYGRQIPFAQQWPLFEALRNTASIIFAVVGAWLAIIYPERLKLTFRKDEQEKAPGPNMGMLLTPAVHSTILLVILLLIGIVAPLAKQLPILQAHIEVCRGVAFVILAVLTLWQVVIVVITLFPAEAVQTQANLEAAEHEIVRHYGKFRQKLHREPAPEETEDEKD
jgi:hypothetical protein